MSNATPHSNLVEGFVINIDELETLAYHYFLNRLAYEWDRFAYPEEPIHSQAHFDYDQEGLRLNAIETFLGVSGMAKMKKVAEAQFIGHFTTGRISNEQWAEFTGKPMVDPEETL